MGASMNFGAHMSGDTTLTYVAADGGITDSMGLGGFCQKLAFALRR